MPNMEFNHREIVIEGDTLAVSFDDTIELSIYNEENPRETMEVLTFNTILNQLVYQAYNKKMCRENLADFLMYHAQRQARLAKSELVDRHVPNNSGSSFSLSSSDEIEISRLARQQVEIAGHTIPVSSGAIATSRFGYPVREFPESAPTSDFNNLPTTGSQGTSDGYGSPVELRASICNSGGF